MKFLFKKATTSQTVLIFIQDSSSTTGAGLTGLTSASSGLTAYYYREGAGTGATAITLAATGSLGTWETGGFFEVDATDMPGWYELGIPDAALATGADFVGIQLKGATNMAQCNLEIQLTNLDVNDGVRAGLTALPNAAADAAGGLPISDAGGLDLDTLDSNVGAVKTKTDFLPSATAGDAGGVFIAGSNAATTLASLAVTDGTTLSNSNGSALTCTSTGGGGDGISATGHSSGHGFDAGGGTSGSGARLSGGTIGNALQITGGATSGDGISVSVTSGDEINANLVGTITGNITGDLSGSVGSVTGAVGSVTGAVGSVTGSVGSVTGAVGSVTGNVGGNVVGSVASVSGNVGGNVVGSVASVTGNIDGNVTGTIGGLTVAALADFFDTDSGTTYASAVAGSVVAEIADNSGGSALTVADIADGVWDEATVGHTTSGTFGEQLKTDVDAILVDTAVIGAAGAGLTEAGGTGDQLTAIPWNASWDTEVQSECNDALVALSLDHLFASATGLEVANSSIIARLVSKSATPAFTDYDNQTDSLQAIRDRGDSAWITATSVTVSDKTGFSLASDGMDAVTLPADIITASSLAADAVQEIWTTTLTEAYAADGATFTGAQGMYMLWSALSEFAIDGTTITAKKLDGSTTSMTFTLDSSTAPTSRTRAT
jgi:hypothetical protein